MTLSVVAPAEPGRRLWLYKRPFSIGVSHECWVLVESRFTGLTSRLIVNGKEVATDFTPGTGPEAIRNHRLADTLPDGRALEVEAGYVNWWSVGIAVRLDGALSTSQPAFCSSPSPS
jgi:hypothetical protein